MSKTLSLINFNLFNIDLFLLKIFCDRNSGILLMNIAREDGFLAIERLGVPVLMLKLTTGFRQSP